MVRNTPWRRRSLAVRLALTVAVASVIAALVLYVSLHRAPQFYRQALEGDAVAARRASQEMGSRATALLNETRKTGHWTGLFTTAQINGWLAVDLASHRHQLLADGIDQPRVAISGDRMYLGFRWHRAGMTMVGSVEIGVAMLEPNVVACRLLSARAGSLPLPLGGVVERISQLAARVELPLSWAEADGDPVAVVTLPLSDLRDDRQIWLERIELRAGQIGLAGHTRNAALAADRANSNAVQSVPAERDAQNSNRQWR